MVHSVLQPVICDDGKLIRPRRPDGKARSEDYFDRDLFEIQERSDGLADLISSSVPRRFFDGLLTGRALFLGILHRIFNLSDEIIVAARNAQYTIEVLVFEDRRDYDRFSSRQVLSHLDRTPVVYKLIVGYPRKNTHIERRRVLRHRRIRLRTEVMNIRKGFDLQRRGSQTEQHPLPFRSFRADVSDQLLIQQPRFDCAKIAQPRMRYVGDVFRLHPGLRSRRYEMVVIYRLFQKPRLARDIGTNPLFFKELATR